MELKAAYSEFPRGFQSRAQPDPDQLIFSMVTASGRFRPHFESKTLPPSQPCIGCTFHDLGTHLPAGQGSQSDSPAAPALDL